MKIHDPATVCILVLPLTVYIVGTSNFYNFMDGINGIAGITGVIGFGLLSYYGFMSGMDMGYVVLCLGLLFSCIGFLPFNVPVAKVFMGDIGSVLLGFVFGGCVIIFSKTFFDFFCLAAFLFPFYSDEMITMVVRLKKRESLARPHRRHIYQILVNELGVDHWKISIAYGTLQLFIGLTVIKIKSFGVLSVLMFLAFMFVVCVVFSFYLRRLAIRKK
jgi:Fuc2NAc and GlcNAc transferase